ncbi:MAG: YihY/virulence factor BrkB family protein [Acetobacteraceae bacterium]|nr:YihY/virulence factor BrkB family protein [Acetobacteraceae bacterium]
MRTKPDSPVVLAVLALIGLFVAPDATRPAPAKQPDPSPRVQGTTSHPAPPPGVWPLTKRVLSEVSNNDLMTQAAAMTFYTLLSIFPAMAMLVSLYGLFADPKTISEQVNNLGMVLPGGGMELLTTELKSLTSSTNSGLGWAFVIGLATSLWTSNQAMKSMFNALNQVHDVKEKRSFIVLTALTLLCTAGTVLFMAVALAGVIVIPAVLAFVGLGPILDVVLFWLRWPLLLVGLGLLLAVLFRFGPCRTKVVWRWITWGSATASIGWMLVSVLFSWYVANFGSYNKTYGSLGAVVGFMTWIWISSTVVLVGAQLDAELEKATVGKQRSRHSHDEAPEVVAAS